MNTAVCFIKYVPVSAGLRVFTACKEAFQSECQCLTCHAHSLFQDLYHEACLPLDIGSNHDLQLTCLQILPLHRTMEQAFESMRQYHDQGGLSWRTSAYMVALRRLAAADAQRGHD
eukprot:scaffold80198_cov15-Tisochrysis_lutea.AAC.1